jgi:hypothetical protein
MSLLQNSQKVAEFEDLAKQKNYSINKAERLPGNVSYIDIRYF